MADTKISADAAAAALADADIFPLVQGGANVKLTAAQLKTYAQAGLSSYTAENARDDVGAALVAGANMTITVDDAGNTITFVAAGGSLYEAGPPGTLPTIASMTPWNIGTSAIAGGTHSHLFTPQNGSTFRGYYKAIAAAPSDIYMRMTDISLSNGPQIWAGILLRNNASGLSVICGYDLSTRYELARATSIGGYSASGLTVFMAGAYGMPKWLRVNVTSTTITCYVSHNGWDWLSLGTETIATYIGAVTHFGFACYIDGANSGAIGIDYLSQTAPV
jgi:hypothetical protein